MTDARLGPQPQRPAVGTIRLTVTGRGPAVVTVHVNGRLVRAGYGTHDITVPAGPTRVEAYLTAAGDHGHAAIELDVAPGAVEPVFYTPPWNHGIPGVMDRTPRTGLRRFASSPTAIVVLLVPVAAVLYWLLR